MENERAGGLLAWQWAHYPTNHTTRFNLLVHLAAVPLFQAATLALLLGWALDPWLSLGGLGVLVLCAVLEGRGHAVEPAPPIPFRHVGDFLARFAVEQWVTFPRWVLNGGWSNAWKQARQ